MRDITQFWIGLLRLKPR